jgi:ribonucleoside-diphosphate reductase alpha chain
MLDNVLDATVWPLPEQQREAQQKRRIGVGFTGLGDALILLGLHYASDEGLQQAESIARAMRDAAYAASVQLAQEKGLPAVQRQAVSEKRFAKRLPKELRAAIKKHGLRNSHLLSIAPTGTVSLAFADNASNGIEPAFSWTYTRKKRTADGGEQFYTVQDHAYRLYKALHGDEASLPECFVSALELSASEHVAMMRCVQPFIDTSISKTVNIPADYPFEDFKHLYGVLGGRPQRLCHLPPQRHAGCGSLHDSAPIPLKRLPINRRLPSIAQHRRHDGRDRAPPRGPAQCRGGQDRIFHA